VRCVPIRKPKPDAENNWGLIGINKMVVVLVR